MWSRYYNYMMENMEYKSDTKFFWCLRRQLPMWWNSSDLCIFACFLTNNKILPSNLCHHNWHNSLQDEVPIPPDRRELFSVTFSLVLCGKWGGIYLPWQYVQLKISGCASQITITSIHGDDYYQCGGHCSILFFFVCIEILVDIVHWESSDGKAPVLFSSPIVVEPAHKHRQVM